MKKIFSPQKRSWGVLPAFIALFSAAAVIMAGLMFANYKNRADNISALENERVQAYDRAEQFEQGSNKLSYEAKMYCESKDMSHFKAYMTELTETRNRDIALQALYRIGLSPREISRMQDAKIASDNLSNREIWAMELVALSMGMEESDLPKGITAGILAETEKNLPAKEQYSRGYQYVMSAAYFTEKSNLDTKVREFTADLMQHYGNSTVEMMELGTSTALISFVTIVILVLLAFGMSILYSRYEKKNTAILSEAMQKARDANNAKSNFLSNMSHDIRTPMNAIVGMTNMALQSIDSREYEKAATDLKIVQSSSRQLLSLINDVLDLSKIESGKIILVDEPYVLPDVIRDVTSVILPLCIAKSQNYKIHAEKLRHEFVIGDQVRVKQVLVNLLNNAYKYTPEGGSIDFFVEELESTSADTAVIQFRIADTGIGIANDKLDFIFEAFSREVNTTVNQVEGTGLGLTIVQSIISARGGTVTVSSEKGKGSTFIVTVPLKIQAEEEALKKYSRLRGKKILVVAEDDQMGSSACAMLDKVGAVSKCTADIGYAAKAVSEDSSLFLAALIDRKTDPVGAVREIRKAAPKQAIILLACDGELKQLTDSAKSAGADGIIEKPVFCSTLCEKIIEICCSESIAAGTEKYLSGKRILVVDDIEINRMIAQVMLESAGAAVERAESGKEAFEKFSRSTVGYYSAILMDVMMPVMGGYDATELIRALPRPDSKTVPIIAMTANAFVEDVKKSREAGMDAHITKPMEAKAVREVLTHFLH